MKECNKTGQWSYGSGIDFTVSCRGNDDGARPHDSFEKRVHERERTELPNEDAHIFMKPFLCIFCPMAPLLWTCRRAQPAEVCGRST